MKKLLIILALSILPISIFSQIQWVDNLDEAKALSLAKNKLIVLDFTASWCGPCRTMDSNLWSSPEMITLANNLIFVKIDIDINPSIARRYGINSIPCVIITTIAGEPLWRELGYSNNNKTYLNIFKQAPSDVSNLNKQLIPFIKDNETTEDYFNVGLAYQELGKIQEKGDLQRIFLIESNRNLKKVKKKDVAQSKEAELRELLNMAYQGRYKNALKNLSKIPDDYFGNELKELKELLKELCTKNAG